MGAAAMEAAAKVAVETVEVGWVAEATAKAGGEEARAVEARGGEGGREAPPPDRPALGPASRSD